jgi:hypothetical protein
VFDRFYRGDASRSSEGTGLGLAIVRAIAVSSGGDAWVTSTPGSGAVFTVEIPLVDQEPTVPPASSPSVGTSDAVGESPPEAGERRDGVGPAPVPPDGAEHRRQFTG